MLSTSLLLFSPGRTCLTTTPGITKGFYIAQIGEILCPGTIEEATGNGSPAPGDDINISGPITASAGGGYYYIPIIEGSGEISFPWTGSAGSGYTFNNGLEFGLRGISDEHLSLIKRLAQCCEGFTILGQCKDKDGWFKIGEDCSPVFLDPGQGQTGKGDGDTKGITVTLKAMENCPPRKYDLDTYGLPLAP